MSLVTLVLLRMQIFYLKLKFCFFVGGYLLTGKYSECLIERMRQNKLEKKSILKCKSEYDRKPRDINVKISQTWLIRLGEQTLPLFSQRGVEAFWDDSPHHEFWDAAREKNKLTDTQTNNVNISFFFPGNESVGGKDPCCLNDISNNRSREWKSISSHRVSITLLLSLPWACLTVKQTAASPSHR